MTQIPKKPQALATRVTSAKSRAIRWVALVGLTCLGIGLEASAIASSGWALYLLGPAGTINGVHQPLAISSVPQSGGIGTVLGWNERNSHDFAWIGNTLISPYFSSGKIEAAGISPNGVNAALGPTPAWPCWGGMGNVPGGYFLVVEPDVNYCLTLRGVNDNGVYVGDFPVFVNGQLVTHGVSTCGINCLLNHISTLGGSFSSARAINNLNTIVGVSSTGGNPSVLRAFFVPTGLSVPQDFDPGHPNYNSTANAISEQGTVVGSLDPGPCPPSPVICQGSSLRTYPVFFHQSFVSPGFTLLGSLGGSDGAAMGVNSANTIVGWSTTAAGARHAFITLNGVMTDLNSVRIAGGLPGIWTFTEADGINDLGQVVGHAVSVFGTDEIFVLVPP